MTRKRSLISRMSQKPRLLPRRSEIPSDLESVSTRGEEIDSDEVGVPAQSIEDLWRLVERLYRSGTHPAIQICIRRSGKVVLNRAIGHAWGNGPDDPVEGSRKVVGLDTPINIFSASKSVTAMVVHKLAEQNVLHLDDPVADFVPEFARYGKQRVTIRHVLAHRAGLPNLPPEAIDLDLLADPQRILEVMCETKLSSRPGRFLAYHAITGGFILGEVVRRATGKSIREVLREEIADPLGVRWMNYGVAKQDLGEVALNYLTGPPPPPPLSQILRRTLGADLATIVDLSNDPRFLTGIVPSANVMTTAEEMSTFFQCLLDEGEHEGRAIFDPRTVRHAVAEQSWLELDFTLVYPIRYGLGFMLGGKRAGPFGTDNPRAFGHIGFSNTFCWADPDRDLSVALLNTGKPVVTLHVLPLFEFMAAVGNTFPRLPDAVASRPRSAERRRRLQAVSKIA